jgi:hypothetical protein
MQADTYSRRPGQRRRCGAWSSSRSVASVCAGLQRRARALTETGSERAAGRGAAGHRADVAPAAGTSERRLGDRLVGRARARRGRAAARRAWPGRRAEGHAAARPAADAAGPARRLDERKGDVSVSRQTRAGPTAAPAHPGRPRPPSGRPGDGPSSAVARPLSIACSSCWRVASFRPRSSACCSCCSIASLVWPNSQRCSDSDRFPLALRGPAQRRPGVITDFNLVVPETLANPTEGRPSHVSQIIVGHDL